MKKHKNVFSVLKVHNENILWLLYIILASLTGIIGFCNTGILVFKNNEIYFISLSIISPLLVDFIIQNLENKLGKHGNRFLKRKTMTIGISLFIIMLIIIGLCVTFNDIFHIVFQSLIYLSSIILSLYMFCLQKLILYGDEYKEFDDKSYDEEIKSETDILIEKQNNISKIENDDGKEIKL